MRGIVTQPRHNRVLSMSQMSHILVTLLQLLLDIIMVMSELSSGVGCDKSTVSIITVIRADTL